MRWTLLLGVVASLLTAGSSSSASEVREYAKWGPIQLEFVGPESRGRGQPNPFATRLDCRFTSPTGRQFVVPGFYDGDGYHGIDGRTWRVRFSADEIGVWGYLTESPVAELNGHQGQFAVTEVPVDARGFWQWGRLEYTGTPENQIRYLKFRDGPYWLKAGCDDPENFLGNYANFNTLSKRKAAVDYLAERKINSLYIMTHNLDGDDNDVWPWLGDRPSIAKENSAGDVRFDLAKLAEWRVLFEHMQSRGVVPYLVLEDDSAWSGYDHRLYYRELIARFGDLPAVVFNLGEEHNENYSLAQGLELAKELTAIDPYDHPIGIHNVNRPQTAYVDATQLDFTSIQTGQPGRAPTVEYAIEHNKIATEWIESCRERGRRILVVNFDEGRPELDRVAWWSAYLAGGVWEAHVVEPYDQPLSAWESTWTELGGARAFMESLPFHEMSPSNDLVVAGQAFCLAQVGEVYACYLPQGGEFSLSLPAGQFECSWWNPANGPFGSFERTRLVEGGVQTFSAPTSQDWALRLTKSTRAIRRSDYFPPPDTAEGWRVARRVGDSYPDVQFSRAKLDRAFDFTQRSTKNGGLLVLRNGQLIYERYFGLGHRDATPNLASCGKSFTSMAVGMLVEEYPALFPDGLDEKVFTPRHLPPEAFPLSDSRKADIRLGQLLAFTAGIRGNNPAYVRGKAISINPIGPDGWQGMVDHYAAGMRDGTHRDRPFTAASLWCEPGQGYSYATASIHLASMMVRHVSGVEMEEYLTSRLAEPLGWGRWGFAYRHAREVDHTPGGGGIALRATDMLRFGYLLLNQGRWGDRQVVPREYVAACSQATDYNPHFPYSFQFTVNTTGHAAGIPRDAFWKVGSGGHVLYVVPSLDLVVWKLGGRDSQYSTNNTGLPPSPASDAAVADRRSWRQSVSSTDMVAGTLRLVIAAIEE